MLNYQRVPSSKEVFSLISVMSNMHHTWSLSGIHWFQWISSASSFWNPMKSRQMKRFSPGKIGFTIEQIWFTIDFPMFHHFPMTDHEAFRWKILAMKPIRLVCMRESDFFQLTGIQGTPTAISDMIRALGPTCEKASLIGDLGSP